MTPLVSRPTGDRLALYASDEADLSVISACMQDALVHRSDMTFRLRERRFAMVASRYRWDQAEAGAKGRRIRTGLHFDGVASARYRGIGVSAGVDDPPFVLLAMTAATKPDGADITLIFANDAAIRLSAECIDCTLRDLGTSWEAGASPDHGL